MAIKDVIEKKQAEEATPAVTPTADGKASKAEAFRQEGAAIRAQMTEDQKAAEGSKSDKVAFVCSLGNPAKRQNRVEKSQNIASHEVVGYKFKVLEDTVVPVAPYVSSNILDVAPATEKTVKAGEVVALNLVETAMFMSRIEYAGKFTGEGTGVNLTVRSAKDRTDPLPVLQLAGEGSIKSTMELVGDIVGAGADGKGGTVTVKPEYQETFGKLFEKRRLGRQAAGKIKKAGNAQANIAAAFRSYYQSKAK